MIAKLIITRSKSLLEVNFGFGRVVLAYLWERPRGGPSRNQRTQSLLRKEPQSLNRNMGAQRHFDSPVESQGVTDSFQRRGLRPGLLSPIEQPISK